MTIWTTAADASRERMDASSAAKALLADPRRVVLHLATFVVVATTLVATGTVDIASGSAPFMSLVLWGALATFDVLAVLAMRAVSGTVDAHPPIPANGGVVMTGSISSTVKLDYDRGTAEKIYEPTRFVKLLYRLSFQAPFPYADNIAALEAARHRRTVAGLLTKFWFGENMVARALDIRPESDGRYTFVTELVRGTEPKDAQRAKATLRKLTERFLDAGLPTWQVGYYNPKAIPNLLERDDGSYRIIDLESNLVTPFMPRAALIRAIRVGQYPPSTTSTSTACSPTWSSIAKRSSVSLDASRRTSCSTPPSRTRPRRASGSGARPASRARCCASRSAWSTYRPGCARYGG